MRIFAPISTPSYPQCSPPFVRSLRRQELTTVTRVLYPRPGGSTRHVTRRITAWSGALRRGVAHCGVVWLIAAWYGLLRCGMAHCGVVWRIAAWCGALGRGMAHCGEKWREAVSSVTTVSGATNANSTHGWLNVETAGRVGYRQY